MTNSQLSDLILRGQLPPHSDNINIVSQIVGYHHGLIQTEHGMY